MGACLPRRGETGIACRIRSPRGENMRCVLLLCALLCAAPAAADDYPSQSIRLIVPFAAGGAVDAVARLLSDPISKGLGKPVVIDNRAGAGGVVGMDAAAQAPADG